LLSRARLTAKVEGAETEATMAILAASAFWTISKEARPLTRRRCRSNGSDPSRNARPIALSTALCRAMSSRAIFHSPSTVTLHAVLEIDNHSVIAIWRNVRDFLALAHERFGN